MLQEQFLSPQLTDMIGSHWDFETSIERLVICNWFMKTEQKNEFSGKHIDIW